MLGWIFNNAHWAMRADIIIVFILGIAYLVQLKKDLTAATEKVQEK